MRNITGYRLTVRAGRLAGTVREYGPNAGTRARRFADRLDNEYGAICATVSPLFSDVMPGEAALMARADAVRDCVTIGGR